MSTLIVLVTGATGVQGNAVIQALLELKANVRALVRSNDTPAAQALAALGVQIAVGDFDNQIHWYILWLIELPREKNHIEHDYVKRAGHIFAPRIIPDQLINRNEAESVKGAPLKEVSLHEAPKTIRLQCDRLGTLDGLNYTEVADLELPLQENSVEVELMWLSPWGSSPKMKHLLGLEGAGIVRRVHSSVTKFKPGDREASTLASVYLTALYSLYNLADTQNGHRVLIHSATGGLGQAAIQICRYIGAEVYATVGTEEKRRYLTDTFGIPPHHIFNSRSITFARELMAATDGKGVDVILNSLTGELLEESWRCIATAGTMVELGKKDMLDRNYLSMEPFGRNASFRCFDMSHKHVSDQLIARLLDQLMGLMAEGHLKPIGPIKTFSFSEMPSAFRFMRGANHNGKIVISDGPQAKVTVPTCTAKAKSAGRCTYLLIGGLRGLCGTVAIQLARLGAKHLVVLSRSGYKDRKSGAVLRNIEANGCRVTLVKGDVAKEDDVQRCFSESPVPVGGVVQGAMVLRDRPFSSMTHTEYHEAIEAKVKAYLELAQSNVFLDNFALYRRRLGLRACSVDLGAIEDVGYMFEHNNLLFALDTAAWININEALFNKIFRTALFQDLDPINPASAAQLVTSVAAPQAANSRLLSDARFPPLCFGGQVRGNPTEAAEGAKEIQVLQLLTKSSAAAGAVLNAAINAAINAVNKQMVVTLRLPEPMEPGKPLTSYGMDSLAAVEFRNWARSELKVELTTLEIANASSLHALCERIVSKLKVG
ncbi:KR domain-containing protein [Nemania serpens]|nr:KR domain-containing protein [Nemania serpens]